MVPPESDRVDKGSSSTDDLLRDEGVQGFSVDTGLFRQLGELLVGRDATALAELVKNAYDADATDVLLTATDLDEPGVGSLVLVDNGIGMTLSQFRRGFLRVAGRTKTSTGRSSPIYGRRYTGEKGVGRLAAHKLASDIRVSSVASIAVDGAAVVEPLRKTHPEWSPGELTQALSEYPQSLVNAHIDWDVVETFETLGQVDETALSVSAYRLKRHAARGTTIALRRLRRPWTDKELAEAARQLSNFEPPPFLIRPLAQRLTPHAVLFAKPTVRDATRDDPGMTLRLEGALGVPTDFWSSVERTMEWVLEIRADKGQDIEYAVQPTVQERQVNAHSGPVFARAPHPAPTTGPFFHARIFIRSGGTPTVDESSWAAASSGVRVYLEGFRVLPYGEPGNDWLSLDSSYTRRSGRFVLDPLLAGRGESFEAMRELSNRDVSLRLLPNRAFFGAVFLTDDGASSLRTLVNREGFVPDAHFETLTALVRKGTDLVLRARALASLLDKQERERIRKNEREVAAANNGVAPLAAEEVADTDAVGGRVQFNGADTTGSAPAPDQASGSVEVERSGAGESAIDAEAWRRGRRGSAAVLLEALKQLKESPTGQTPTAQRLIIEVEQAAEALASDASLLRVLASVGAQLAAFHHELQHMLPAARGVEDYLRPKRQERFPPGVVEARADMTQLRRTLERQASYLADVASARSRDRRVRQVLRERFDIAVRTVQAAAAERSIQIYNDIPVDVRTPPMFPAEVLAILTNLLTNAVRAAGQDGRVWVGATAISRDYARLLMENTGVAVPPAEGEKWFAPFASTSVAVDSSLGQGTGLGLPIVRDMLAEYGGTVRFVTPNEGFNTAVEVMFRA